MCTDAPMSSLCIADIGPYSEWSASMTVCVPTLLMTSRRAIEGVVV